MRKKPPRIGGGDFAADLQAFATPTHHAPGRACADPKENFMRQKSIGNESAVVPRSFTHSLQQFAIRNVPATSRKHITPICRAARFRSRNAGRFVGLENKHGVGGGDAMRYDRPKRLDASSSGQRCKILPFRLPDDIGKNNDIDAHPGRAAKNAGHDIAQLLDLSRYENPKRNADDYRARMVENVAAIFLLSALIAVAACDLLDLQQIQHCASLGAC